MGWASATALFDPYVKLVMEHVPLEKQKDLIYRWYCQLKNEDWDTEDESDYWDILLPILKEMEPDKWTDQVDNVVDDIMDRFNFSYQGVMSSNVKNKLRFDIENIIRQAFDK